jgi:hypothetical protein
MALRKRESKLFDRIKKNIKNVHFTRIESSTVNGIPDVHACAEGKSFWIELKSNTYQTLLQSAIETYRVKGVLHSSTIPQLDLELVHSTPDPVPVSRWDEIRSVLLT